MTKTEIFLNLLIEILNNPRNRIAQKEFMDKYEINYKTWRKYIKEMNETYLIDALPIFNEMTDGDEKFICINKSMFKYHYPSHLETAFYFEAYQKIGHIFNHQNLSDDLEELKSEVFQLNGRGEQMKRKFHYLAKTDGIDTNDDNQAILVQALIENKKIKAIYNEKEYSLYPLCLTMHRGSLYLVAYKDAMIENNLRHLKLVRFNHIEITGDVFSYPGEHEWNPDEYFKSASGIFNDKIQECTLRVFAPSKNLIKEKNFFNSEIINDCNESMDIKVQFSNIDEFLGQLFIYAQDIEVLEGDEVIKAFREKAQLALSRNKAA